MEAPPPRWIRRLLIWPLPILVLALYLATVPLLLIAAVLVSYRLPGNLRAVRSLGLATTYLVAEAFAEIAALVLWIASGFGWKLRSPAFVTAHYTVLRWTLSMLVGVGRRLFSLEIKASGRDLPVHGHDSEGGAVPLIVMSRHAGPADSLLLLHEILSWRGRRPRIVAKDLLQLDPTLDIYLNRLPNRFISPNPKPGERPIDAIGQLASGMTGLDAFVIFPEGGNFTPGRRLRAIDRLRRDGHHEAAARAAKLRNVLPPRPGGTKAALEAAPCADAVFVAHTGLDSLATIGDLWLSIPVRKTIEMNWHVVVAETIPRSESAQEEMLLRAWEEIDRWIDVQRESDRPLPGR